MPEKKKILVVDDEAPVCEALAFTLGQEGYEITSSTDLDKAVYKLAHEKFHLVLSDVRLPGAQGLEALGRLRRTAPDVPVLLISGFASPREAAEAVRQGAVDYLDKPVDSEVLLASIQRTLKGPGPGWQERMRLLKALDELAEARKKERQNEALKTMGLFAVGIAHELSNPLSAIMGYAHLLMGRPELHPKNKDDVRQIKQQALHCRDLVHMLLRQIHNRPQARNPVFVDAAIREAYKLAKPSLHIKKIPLSLRLGAPGLRVIGSAIEIEQIVLNLVSNAAAAMEGLPEAEVELETQERDGAVRIIVSDNGPGVPPEHHERIFQPFFTTKSGGRGTGLGLSLSRNIVERLGGSIAVSDRNGRGAVFTVSLPTIETAAGKKSSD